MSLESIEPIQIVDISPDKSFVPYLGLEREKAHALASDFAKQQEEISAAAIKNKGNTAVTWTSDGHWVHADVEEFEMIARDDNEFFLTHSKNGFGNQIAAGLGVNSSYYLGTGNGIKYFFDAEGNFGKVSGLDNYEPDCVSAHHSTIGRPYFYKKEQMHDDDFEYVTNALSSMRNGITPQVSK